MPLGQEWSHLPSAWVMFPQPAVRFWFRVEVTNSWRPPSSTGRKSVPLHVSSEQTQLCHPASPFFRPSPPPWCLCSLPCSPCTAFWLMLFLTHSLASLPSSVSMPSRGLYCLHPFPLGFSYAKLIMVWNLSIVNYWIVSRYLVIEYRYHSAKLVWVQTVDTSQNDIVNNMLCK